MELNGSIYSSTSSKNFKKFPYALLKVDESTETQVLRHFKGPLTGLLQVGPEKWILSKYYAENAENLYNFEARPNDIYISTFPRSGTTWTQEMMWLLCNDLNYEAAKATKLDFRFPFFEFTSLLPKDPGDSPLKALLDSKPAQELLAQTTSQRLLKTHLPIKLMPHDALQKGCKIVYVARNPKDVIVSCYHFYKIPTLTYEGNFEQFLDYFMDDLIPWGPYFEHIKDGWSHRKDKNVLFLFYEDLVMDLDGSLKKLASFLERSLSDSDLPELREHLNFKNFQQNSSVNKNHLKNLIPVSWDNVRRGQIGGNSEITPEITEKIDKWTQKQLKGSDLQFPHQ